MVRYFALSECNGLWDYLKKSEEHMLKEVVKEYFIMEKEEKISMAEEMKPSRRENVYMEISLN